MAQHMKKNGTNYFYSQKDYYANGINNFNIANKLIFKYEQNSTTRWTSKLYINHRPSDITNKILFHLGGFFWPPDLERGERG